MALTAVTGFSEPFLDTHPYYRGTYYRVVSRTATGPGNGSSSTAYARTVTRLDDLVDFHTGFYGNGGRFYLGVRAVIIVTASAYGNGTASSSANVLRQRQASNSGVGSSSASRLVFTIRTGTGSGTGTSSAISVRIVPRTTTSSGSGSQSADWNINPARTATGSGVGSSAIVVTRVVLRTGSNSGAGASSTNRLLIAIRTASNAGSGASTSVGARTRRATATGSGSGNSSSLWVKSHIFRVPYTNTYPGGYFGGGDSANRLQRYNRSNIRYLNLYKLVDGTYTTVDQRDQGQVEKLWHGGRDHFLTDDEVTELTAAGFGASIT